MLESKTQVYKFYKKNCAPCYALSRILLQIAIPDHIEIIPVNAENEENKELLSQYGIIEVPVLAFADGYKITGLQSKLKIETFLNKEN